MKNVIVVALLGMLVVSGNAYAASTSATIDADCRLKRATFVVPPKQTATNLSMTLNSSWLPCGGTGTPTRMGGKLIGPTGAVLYYGVQYYNGKREILAGNLTGLVLAPGTYTVEAPDGGKQTRATLSFTLTKAPPPPVPPAGAAQSGWGTLSGQWSDPAVKSTAKIIQTGNTMTITNTFNWQGKSVQWVGNGTVNGNAVTFTYAYTRNKPALFEPGVMTLTRTNEKTLKGKWVTHSKKYQQAITFIQTKSDAKKQQPKPTAAKPAATPQPTPKPYKGKCGKGFVDRGDGQCLPLTIKKEER